MNRAPVTVKTVVVCLAKNGNYGKIFQPADTWFLQKNGKNSVSWLFQTISQLLHFYLPKKASDNQPIQEISFTTIWLGYSSTIEKLIMINQLQLVVKIADIPI